ncbi:selenocysteine-specific translation elongation factor [Sediminibacillus albus]|uniref:Selenocysteine-specific elongation factor n=1 Tax=Sediminibacillus albus TaxID=407036 RepID=A0A1G8WHA4_9BACI|nr:selenocysteine-specific translation elongation factor [Sediminibacillus albus]SDJ77055.1 selenocysteine-specific elongation factor [Sediminibacillus albus]
MDAAYYTIGMAGHIDHGKTTLTKALTNVDTDRLKEEKERNISIEAGYAPLHTNDGTHISIIDVPGHERFIRQMIAGVAGIDLVVLVVAADEGVMPQTREHLEILQFLGVKRCIVAVTKIGRVDGELQELVGMDIKEALSESIFADAEMHFVDSISGKGVEQLREAIFTALKDVEFRDRFGSFRLPIDQVFTVQGQGTIVRGTIYEGIVRKGTQLTVLPSGKSVRARNIQVHHKDIEEARAGQRTAVNLTGIDRAEMNRGDVLVASDHFLVTKTIDVAVRLVEGIRYPVKQRTPVKLHVGTSEVMGKIVFFDRNEVQESGEEILCQIRLDNEIVVRRGDKFIIRRPTPAETIGGGWVIDPKGEKYRFGESTVAMLQKKMEGTPEDLVVHALEEHILLNRTQLIQLTSLDGAEVDEVLRSAGVSDRIIATDSEKYTLVSMVNKASALLLSRLEEIHQQYPMRAGVNKAELRQNLITYFSKSFVEFVIETLIKQGKLRQDGQFITAAEFLPHLPPRWENRLQEIISHLRQDGLAVKKWEEYFTGAPVPEDMAAELKNYLLQSEQAYKLTEEMIVHRSSIEHAVHLLKEQTGVTFDLKEAKEIWKVSRKYMIPLLELLDQWRLTEREDNKRRWQ